MGHNCEVARIEWQLRQSDKAWLALLGFIVVVEVILEEDDMLSHAAARCNKAHPFLVPAVGLTTVAHLCEWIDPRFDPYRLAFHAVNKARRVFIDASWLLRGVWGSLSIRLPNC